jgi:hypothetical protein
MNNQEWIPVSERLTRKSESGMTWFVDRENHDMELEPCEMSSHHNRVAIEKLADYEDAEEQGLLMRLPCKVGDIVWDNNFGKPCSYEVTGFSFGDLNEDDEWCDEVLNQVMVFYSNGNRSVTGRFAVSEIGKTVFLTKSDAEQALEELRNV